MSYREIDDPHPFPEVCDVPSYAEIHLLNGVSTEFVIPCRYLTPALVDGDDDVQTPIHLTAEGYADPVVAFSAAPAGLTGESWIDADDDSLVHVVISAQCPSAVTTEVMCEASILITRTPGSHGVRTDCLFRGPIRIKAAPLPAPGPAN